MYYPQNLRQLLLFYFALNYPFQLQIRRTKISSILRLYLWFVKILYALWNINGKDLLLPQHFGKIPIFEFSLIILFGVGAIYWFGFKRRSVISSGERRAEALAD